ncbi:uracil-xanthine permease family protein [Lachnoclostridium phytofermentans]|uniref:uracil-xanthine permease family protein n=1 Tax=Lachnoclostridium phytofermentans TaxID=66219 RepID=UPI0004DFBBB5|nr:uracil-xanthine permease family protein [Lachnoclostridium phytofermentans]
MTKEQNTIGTVGIYDAKSLGIPKMILLGLQHAFAMFGATVLVPLLTGLSVSTTLLMAGLGTLLFHILTKGKVPAFLGSSFAFIGGYTAVAPIIVTEVNGQIIETPNAELLPYACGGVLVAGLVYVLLAALIKVFGVNKIMRFFPPVVTGPIIISIGLILAPTAITNCQKNWLLAIVALAVIIICNIFGKGMVKIIPIMLGIIVSYIVALIMGEVDFTTVTSADWIGNPVPVSGFAKFSVSSIISIVPIALATMMEHIGDISAISATTGKNYMADPGLHRTLLGDGLATSLSAMFGGPANTTYGENTGVLALTKVYDPKVMQIAACFAIFLSFFPKFSAIINTLPVAIIGGVSLILYGMISSVGIRNVVENRVDFTKSRNLIIAAIILGCALGFNGIGGLTFTIASHTIELSGLAVAAIAGIVLNAILPGNDYVFDTEDKHDELTFKL